MASIDVYDIGSTSFSVRLIGLETIAQGADYTRQCMWNVYENPNADGTGGTLVDAGNSYIEPIKSTTNNSGSGGDYYFSNMTPNTTYRVLCYVYNYDTGKLVATLKTSANFKTASSGGSTTWSLTSMSNANSSFEVPMSVKAYQLYRIQVSFPNAGMVRIYTEGTLDTLGYLSTLSTENLTDGCPMSSLYDDDDSGDDYNFYIYESVQANTPYYIWVRAAIQGDSGSTKLYVVGPAEPDEPDIPDDGGPLPAPADTVWTRTSGATLTKKDYVNLSLPRYTIDIVSISFENSGIATFYTTDATVDVYGYLTLEGTAGYDNKTGRPYSSLTEADGYEDDAGLESDGSDWDFSFSYSVKAGVTYYIGVRAFDGAVTGTTTLHVIRPPIIPKWSWGASNGSASVVQTMAAENAVRNKQSTKNFSHLVWNDMVDKVKAISDKAVGWWDSASYGLSAENTKAIANSDGEYELSAKMFNTLRNNLEIAGIEVGLSKISDSSIPHPVYSGEKVFGHYFTTLTDYMNSVIDKL